LQTPCVVWEPLLHEASTHTAVAPHFSQPPPWHLPSVPHVAGGVEAHRPRGSVVPFVTLVQAPSAPPVNDAEQAWQAPAHAVSQQKPSTQKPLWHWSATAQEAPCGAVATQVPPAQ
jgi:hypothetical protein